MTIYKEARENIEHLIAPLGISAHNTLLHVLPRPLTLWMAWRHGLNGGTLLHSAPGTVAWASGVVGAGFIFNEILEKFHSDIHFDIPVPLIAAISVTGLTWATSRSLNDYIQGQAEKHDERLETNPNKYINSRLRGGKIATTAQAYVVGRGIHQIGYEFMDITEQEVMECDNREDRKENQTLKTTLEEKDFKAITEAYYRYKRLIILSEQAGFLDQGSNAQKYVQNEFTQHVDAGMDIICAAFDEPHFVEKSIGRAEQYRDRIMALPDAMPQRRKQYVRRRAAEAALHTAILT
jgi:hypothetical protein